MIWINSWSKQTLVRKNKNGVYTRNIYPTVQNSLEFSQEYNKKDAKIDWI